MKYLIIIIIFLTSCSTVPINKTTSAVTPQSRIYQPDSGLELITFYRDKGLFGIACVINVYIDDKKLASVKASERFDIRVSKGKYLFRIEGGNGFCPRITDVKSVNINGVKNFRILFPFSGAARLIEIK